MLDRGLLALGFFILGLNGIYLGCNENGSNNKRNPLWGMLSGIVEIEKLFLCGVAIVVGFFVLRQLVAAIQDKTDRYQHPKQKNILSIKRNHFEPAHKLILESKPSFCYREASRPVPEKQIENVKQETNPFLCEKNVTVQKPKPSAKELKENALADLLRR